MTRARCRGSFRTPSCRPSCRVASVGQYGDADVLPVEGTAALGADGSDTCCSSTCGSSGDRHSCLPRCVVEGCGGSARVVSGRGTSGGTVFPTASVGAAARAPACADATVALTTALATGGTVPSATSVGGGTRIISCSSGIGGNIGGGTGDQRYCFLGRIN